MRLYLIDGTYELFRSYFGAPKRTLADGREVGAVHGIVTSTLRLLGESEMTHVAAAFDSVIESYRNEVYAGYKTGAGTPEDLLEQFPLAERAMRACGVTVWPMYEYETDDALATAAMRWAGDVDQVVVMSPDKDMTQLYGHPRIVGYNVRTRQFMDADGVVAKFGVEPESIPDYLALVGDTADGYPGLKGWGAKSASTVLAKFKHIEDIPLEASLWNLPVRGAETLVASLRAGVGDALLYRYLAYLRRDVPLPDSLSDLEWKGAPRETFKALCDELGFGTLRDRPSRWA
jgi:5'-3' exonuclease